MGVAKKQMSYNFYMHYILVRGTKHAYQFPDSHTTTLGTALSWGESTAHGSTA